MEKWYVITCSANTMHSILTRTITGAPVDLAPLRDDAALAANASLNNDFLYNPQSQDRCPFAAHTRKTNPRSDLFALGAGTEAHRILRRGIQFGPEVTPNEAESKKSSDDEALERGLLFVSYQSNIFNGFQFLQKSKLIPRRHRFLQLIII
jgi:deferrochelatase/peroxidase EfeB